MDNVFSNQLILAERKSGYTARQFTLADVYKVGTEYRCKQLTEDNMILWVTPAGSKRWTPVKVSAPAIGTPSAPAHEHDYTFDVEYDAVYIYMRCRCGAVESHRLATRKPVKTERKVSPLKNRAEEIVSPFPCTRFVYNDTTMDAGVWMTLDMRPDGLVQGYIDETHSSVLAKYIVRQYEGQWIINHAWSRTEKIISHLNMPKRTDYCDEPVPSVKPAPVSDDTLYDEDGEEITE